MAARTLEYQRSQEQKRFRMLSLALQGIHLAIGASGVVQFEKGTLQEVQTAFQGFCSDLLGIGEPPEPKLSLAALKFKYGSRWEAHLDELREEDKVSM